MTNFNDLVNAVKTLETLTTGDQTGPFDHLIGERVILRTRIHGVSIGTLDAVTTGDGCSTYTLSDAWQLWSWSDSAFTLSEAARTGAKARLDKHPDGIVVVVHDGSAILPMTEEAWGFFMEHKTEGAK